MIQMFALLASEWIPSINKESDEAQGGSPIDLAVIRFSEVYIPHSKIEDIPSVILGKNKDQYALTSITHGVAMFIDTTMVPFMYVKVDLKNPVVDVWFPFSQPAYPVDAFLDVNEIGRKIVHYAQSVNPDYPVAVKDIPGFLEVQRRVDDAKQRAIQRDRTT